MKTHIVRLVLIVMLSLPLYIFGSLSISGQENQEQQNSGQEVTSKISTKDGLETVGFDTLNGRVEASMPDDVSSGDTISGTVIAEPKGDTKEEMAQNQDELSGYVVEVEKCKDIKEPQPVATQPESEPTPAAAKPKTLPPPPVVTNTPPAIKIGKHHDHSFTCLMPAVEGIFSIVLKKADGQVVARHEVKNGPAQHKTAILMDSPPACQIPADGTCGETLLIPGTYDGRSSTSKVKVNGQNCLVIAESPRRQIVRMPPNTPGKCTIESSECGFIRRATIILRPPIAHLPERQVAAPKSSPIDLNGIWNSTWTVTGGTYSQLVGNTNNATIKITQSGNSIVIGTTKPSDPPFRGSINGTAVTGEQIIDANISSSIQLTYDRASGQLAGECIARGNGVPGNPAPWQTVSRVTMHR